MQTANNAKLRLNNWRIATMLDSNDIHGEGATNVKLAKILSLVTTLSMASLTLGFAMLFYNRMQLSYGPSGQYFDARSGVTFSDDAVLVYGLLAMVGCIATIWSTCWMIQVIRREALRRRRKNGD